MSERPHSIRKLRVLVAGCGYVGTQLSTLLAARRNEVWGLRRNPTGLPPSIRPIQADLLDPRLGEKLPAADQVVYAAAADASTPEGYRSAYLDGVRNLLNSIEAKGGRINRFVFLSSTAVYGEASGKWIDEETPPSPESFRGEILLQGEEAVREAIRRMGGTAVTGGEGTPNSGTEPSAIVLRLGGIYGPSRTRLLERVRSGEARCRDGMVEWSNRIHRNDAAGAALHLLQLSAPAPTYIGVDNEPVPLCDVYRYVARLLRVPEPEVDPSPGDAAGSRVSVSAGERGKRCSNRRLRDSGYNFLVPTFREGYSEMILEDGTDGE